MAIGVLVVQGCSDSSSGGTTASGSSVPTTVDGAGSTTSSLALSATTTEAPDDGSGIEALDPGPLAARWDAAVVAAGGRVVVYGGTAASAALDDGAAFDPATSTWEALPTSGGLAEGAEVGFAVGDDVVLAGPGGVARLSLVDGVWAGLDPSPYPDGRFVATSSWLVALEDDPTRGVEGTPGAIGVAVFDPETGSWEDAPPVPAGEVLDLVETGGLLVAMASGVEDPSARVVFAMGAEGWMDLEMPQIELSFGVLAVGAGKDVFVWGGGAPGGAGELNEYGLSYSATDDSWHEVAPLRSDWWECYVSVAVWAGQLILDVCAVVAIYDRDTDSMTEVSTLVAERQTWAPFVNLGEAAYRWGAVNCYGECADPPSSMVFQRVVSG